MRSASRPLHLLCLFLALGRPAADAQDVAPGTPIVAVRIDRHDVFDLDDPATSSWPYRWVDAVHIMTRESFIRSLLLFKAGDRLDPLQLAESEIILRATGFLNPVKITARPVTWRGRGHRRDPRPVDPGHQRELRHVRGSPDRQLRRQRGQRPGPGEGAPLRRHVGPRTDVHHVPLRGHHVPRQPLAARG